MRPKTLFPDPRYFQVFFQLFFLGFGLLWLGWSSDWIHYLCSITGCLLFNHLAVSVVLKKRAPLFGPGGWTQWGFSALISALSLCLLLKTNHWYTSVLAAFLTVVSKFLFRLDKKHLFNPSSFGIVATVWITGDAWLSPGQWGNTVLLFFLIISLGTIVVTRVQKLDSSLGFIIPFAGLLYCRQVLVLGWPADYFLHSISSGSLLLFTFFMISDPKTSPDHPLARIAHSAIIALVAFYLAAFQWMNNTPLIALVVTAPLVPLLDRLFHTRSFQWPAEQQPIPFISSSK